MTLKNRRRSKKTEGRTRPKSKGGSLAVGTYLQRGSAPPGFNPFNESNMMALKKCETGKKYMALLLFLANGRA